MPVEDDGAVPERRWREREREAVGDDENGDRSATGGALPGSSDRVEDREGKE